MLVYFVGHRRASFPHAHVPLKSLSSHSSKNFAALIEEVENAEAKRRRKEKKKKKKKKSPEKPKKEKPRPIFPSKSATMSPAIPEVEVEEFSVSNLRRKKSYLFIEFSKTEMVIQ